MPPTISIVSASFDPASIPNDASLTALLTVITTGAVTGVTADLTVLGGASAVPLDNVDTDTWQLANVSCTPGESPTTYGIPCTATDGIDTIVEDAPLIITAAPPIVNIVNARFVPESILNDGIVTTKAVCDITVIGGVIDHASVAVPWLVTPLDLLPVGRDTYESATFTAPEIIAPDIYTGAFVASCGAVMAEATAGLTVIEAIAAGWSIGRVATEYNCVVEVDPGVSISDVHAAYPTPNWISAIGWDDTNKRLSISGVPDLSGRFEIVIMGTPTGGGSDIQMPSPGDDAFLVVEDANLNPLTRATSIAGSKRYVLEPGDSIEVVTVSGGVPSIDPDMTFQNTDPLQSVAMVMTGGGILVGIKPAFITPANADAYMNEPYEYNGLTPDSGPAASGTAPIRFALVSGPTDFFVHPSTGVISWTPTAIDENPYRALIRALNAAGHADQEIEVTVSIRRTEITNAIPDTIPNGVPFSMQLTAIGTPIVHWSAVINPADVTFHLSPTGFLTWDPNVSTATDFSITVTATGPGGTDVQTFPVHIEP